jgi:hypothetical protein
MGVHVLNTGKMSSVMQPRWTHATPQMMQRHTGTAWPKGDYLRPKKPMPAMTGKTPTRMAPEVKLKELGLKK